MGGVLGLDYTAVKACMEALGREVTPELWTGLQAMEEGALLGFQERARS